MTFSKTLVWSGPYINGNPLDVPVPADNPWEDSILLQAVPSFHLIHVGYENRMNPLTGEIYRFRVGSGL